MIFEFNFLILAIYKIKFVILNIIDITLWIILFITFKFLVEMYTLLTKMKILGIKLVGLVARVE